MDLITLFILAAGLSMDAFAVAVCKGLAMRRITVKKAATVAGWFGSFQALMPAVGYMLGIRFRNEIAAVDHWISFFLLLLIGVNMIREAIWGKTEEGNDSLSPKEMFVLAAATSIDALAVGITFAFLNVNIFTAVVVIGSVTFILSMAGVKAGNQFGMKYKAKAEIAGGAVLIFLGIKILAEHIGIF